MTNSTKMATTCTAACTRNTGLGRKKLSSGRMGMSSVPTRSQVLRRATKPAKMQCENGFSSLISCSTSQSKSNRKWRAAIIRTVAFSAIWEKKVDLFRGGHWHNQHNCLAYEGWQDSAGVQASCRSSADLDPRQPRTA